MQNLCIKLAYIEEKLLFKIVSIGKMCVYNFVEMAVCVDPHIQ